MHLGSQNWQDCISNGCIHPLFKWDLCIYRVKIGWKSSVQCLQTLNLSTLFITDNEQKCPLGYIEKAGDISGHGMEKLLASSIEKCADLCSINSTCCVFEYSPSKTECQLHKNCDPDSCVPFDDFVFCENSKYSVHTYQY